MSQKTLSQKELRVDLRQLLAKYELCLNIRLLMILTLEYTVLVSPLIFNARTSLCSSLLFPSVGFFSVSQAAADLGQWKPPRQELTTLIHCERIHWMFCTAVNQPMSARKDRTNLFRGSMFLFSGCFFFSSPLFSYCGASSRASSI